MLAVRPRYVAADRWPQQPSDPKNPDLAHLAAGARITASSYDGFKTRHPLFAIDGEVAATVTESWGSEIGDRRPWLRIEFARRSDIEAVQVVYASDSVLPLDVTLRCERVEQGRRSTIASRPIIDETPSGRPHLVGCPDSDGILLDFEGIRTANIRQIGVAEVVVRGKGS
jgi:hypothetical protein